MRLSLGHTASYAKLGPLPLGMLQEQKENVQDILLVLSLNAIPETGFGKFLTGHGVVWARDSVHSPRIYTPTVVRDFIKAETPPTVKDIIVSCATKKKHCPVEL